MIDLHCHLLPGVDDGAGDLGESLEMCRLLVADGCTAAVATPHLRHERWWNGDRAALETGWRSLGHAAPAGFEVHLGGEIAVSSASLDEIFELPAGALLTLAGSRYVLLELDVHGFGPDPVELVHELIVAGLFPIIAHPERIAWLARDEALVAALVERGALLQLTAMSVTGELGRPLRDVCARWLDAGWVHFVASDAHGVRLRPPGLSTAREVVAGGWGNARAQALFAENPAAVVADRALGEVR